MAIINCYDVNGDAIRSLTQWDHDISIRATGVKTSPIPEFRFSNKHSQKSKCISGVVVGDGVKVTIPNGFLQEALPIYVQLFYTYPSGDAKTEHTFVIPVKPASMPDGAVYEPVEVRSIVELEKRVKALEENGVPGAGGVPSNPSFDTVSLGGDAGVAIIPEGTADAPAITFYGAQGDEPVALNNVADATDDRSAPNLGQVKQLVEAHSGQNPPQDGEDGFSPIATVTQTVDGATISITDANGTTTATVTNGKDGKDGADGYTPVKGVDYFDGQPGKDGADGRDGSPGADGYTPIKGKDYFDGEDGKDGSPGKDGVDGNGIKSAALNADYTLTLTFDDGTTYTTPSIRGATGSSGKDGPAGAAGKDGTDGVGIESIKQTTTSTADGGNNVFTVTLTNGTSATFTVKNGSKGSTGATGPKGSDASVTAANIKSALGYTPADAADVEAISDSLFEEATVTHEVKGANILPVASEWTEGISIKNWSVGTTTFNDTQTNSGYYTSPIIEIEEGVEYATVSASGGHIGWSALGIYDANGKSLAYPKSSAVNTIPITAGAKYIRVSLTTSQFGSMASIQPVDAAGQKDVSKVAGRTSIVTETIMVDKIALFERNMMRRCRFIDFSDLHYNESSSAVAASDERMQLLVDAINAEHAKRTVDFCICNGDIAIGSLKSSVEAFATKWADKFKMPVFWFPGDHDDVNDANWAKIFGNHRQASMEDGNFYFIWLDVYSDANDDGAESSGVRTSTVIDTAWVEQEIAKAGTKPVILMTHYVYADTWYPGISNLLDRYPQIVAVISSHSHNNAVGTIGANNAVYVQTGNFSYPNGADWSKRGSNNEHLWGFANFEVMDGGLYHWYIQPAHNYTDIGVDMPYTEGKKSLVVAMPNTKSGADINLTRHRK